MNLEINNFIKNENSSVPTHNKNKGDTVEQTEVSK